MNTASESISDDVAIVRFGALYGDRLIRPVVSGGRDGPTICISTARTSQIAFALEEEWASTVFVVRLRRLHYC